MMKSELETYIVKGKTLDNVWVYKNYKLLEECSKDEMRQHGYVPALDVEPDIQVYMDGDHFDYTMTIYGVYKGLFAVNYEGYIAEWDILVDK